MSPREDTILKYVLGAGFIILVGIAAYYGYSQYELASGIEVDYYSARVVSSSATQMVVDIDIIVTNQSDIDLNVNGYSFNIYVNGNFVSKATSSAASYIAANDYSLLTIQATFNPGTLLQDLFTSSLAALQAGTLTATSVRVTGTVSATFRGLSVKDIPVDITDSLSELLSTTPTS